MKQGWKLCRAKRYVVTCMKGYHIYNSMVRAQTRYVHIPRYVLGRNCIKQISMNVVRAGTLGEKPWTYYTYMNPVSTPPLIVWIFIENCNSVNMSGSRSQHLNRFSKNESFSKLNNSIDKKISKLIWCLVRFDYWDV